MSTKLTFFLLALITTISCNFDTTYHCKTADSNGCATCFADFTMDSTENTCTEEGLNKCWEANTTTSTMCQLCYMYYRLLSDGTCSTTKCTIRDSTAAYCYYDGSTETAQICNPGYYKSATANECVNTGTNTNQIANCKLHYLNNSLSGNVDKKCYECNSGYILSNDSLECLDQLTMDFDYVVGPKMQQCRILNSEKTACQECVYKEINPPYQISTENLWCAAGLVAIKLGFMVIYLFL